MVFFFNHIRMSGKNINFGEKNKKSDFCKIKKVTEIGDIDINKILFSKEELCGTKVIQILYWIQ